MFAPPRDETRQGRRSTDRFGFGASTDRRESQDVHVGFVVAYVTTCEMMSLWPVPQRSGVYQAGPVEVSGFPGEHLTLAQLLLCW
eukprot:6698053-Prymnesium_polylepis.1